MGCWQSHGLAGGEDAGRFTHECTLPASVHLCPCQTAQLDSESSAPPHLCLPSHTAPYRATFMGRLPRVRGILDVDGARDRPTVEHRLRSAPRRPRALSPGLSRGRIPLSVVCLWQRLLVVALAWRIALCDGACAGPEAESRSLPAVCSVLHLVAACIVLLGQVAGAASGLSLL